MFKYAFNFIAKHKFIQLKKKETLKNIHLGNVKKLQKRYFTWIKFPLQFEKTYFRPDINDKKPVILLSSILTYLGFQKKAPEENESELISTIKKGILLMQKEEYDKSEIMLHLALKIAQDLNDEDGVTYVNDVLGNLAFASGQTEKAEKLFVDVLQRLIAKGEKEDSNRVIHISLKLAKIFQDTKDYKKAEEGFKFCIEALDKKLEGADEDTLALWGMSMDWYARFLLDINKKDDALKCFEKAYDMCVKLNGEEHEQTVILLNDLGTVSSLMGNADLAMTYFEKARVIGNKLPDMKDLAAIYVNLGHLYLLREMYEESKNACEEGLRKAKIYEDNITSSEAKQCLENIKKVFEVSSEAKELKQLGLTVTGRSTGLKGAQSV